MFLFKKEQPKAGASQPREATAGEPVSSTSASQDRLGLTVLHEPHSGVTNPVSLIFVHGLGGSSIRTWTNTPSKTFWPTFLRVEDGLQHVRIATFGYDADFTNILSPKNALGIPDFAGQLVDSLDTHYRKYGNVCLPYCATNARLLQYLSRIAWVAWL
jgi:hypothetical protein